MFMPGANATGGRMVPPGNLSLRKELWLNVCLGADPRSVGIALTDGLCDSGGIILAEDLHDCGRWAVPLLNYNLAFSLQLRKRTENLSQRRHYSLCRLGSHFRSSLGWTVEYQSSSVTRG
jgi:hypothetical protein